MFILAITRSFQINNIMFYNIYKQYDGKESFHIQLVSEKCTGQYFKVRDDDLSSKQSLCTFKMILKKNYSKIF